MESWGLHLGWKRPLKSLCLTITPALPSLPLNRVSTHLLNLSRDGESSTALGSLFQGLTTRSEKKEVDFPKHDVTPLPGGGLSKANHLPSPQHPKLCPVVKRILLSGRKHHGNYTSLCNRICYVTGENKQSPQRKWNGECFNNFANGENEIKFYKEEAHGEDCWCLTQRAACCVINLEPLEGENGSLSPFQNMLKFPGSGM